MRAEKDGEAVITAYAKNDVSLCGLTSGALVNASPNPYLIADCDKEFAYTVVDCTGTETARGVLPVGLTHIDVPHSGVVFFRAAD